MRGHVHQQLGTKGGLQFSLAGVDGTVYFGSHMETFGVVGDVKAGEPLGTVGGTGNARRTRPHLHFEIHPAGAEAVNPYRQLLAVCK